MAADQFRGDENVFLGLFEIRFREAEESEAFGCHFEDAVCIDRRPVEHGGRAVFLLAFGAFLAVLVAALDAVILPVVAMALVRFATAGLLAASFAFFAALFGSGSGLLAVVVGGRVVDGTAAGDAADAGIFLRRGFGLAAFDLR